MKIRVAMKTPDGVEDAVIHAVADNFPDLFADTRKHLVEIELERLRKWVRRGEYVTIEFDTDAITATVLCE